MIAFIVILVLNTLLSVAYVVWGYFFYPIVWKKGVDDGTYNRFAYMMRGIVMFLCPIVGPLFFGIGLLWRKIFFHGDVDLDEIIFSKERVETFTKADVDQGRNLVPLEEAMLVSDQTALRNLMLNVVKGDVEKSLSAIALALNSEDSETAHYAASILRDYLNDFRTTVQTGYEEMQKDPENIEEYATTLIPYMNGILRQHVFADIEQKGFVYTLDQIGELFFSHDKDKMESMHFERICERLLDEKEYDLMAKWCERLVREYPDTLLAYTCRLKLYFSTGQKDRFFTILKELKASNIILDAETIEMIRVFQ
ncbi:hypothetical protein FACS1894111_06680 [Clostridia bacterium]|nr:hypothetical protein FACS1894111_06680 [Clostridia bacterium]